MGTPLLSSVSPARRQLIGLMQRVNFGRIERLAVRGGEPVLEPPPRVVVEHKFGSENGPRPEARLGDFRLKPQHLDLLALLDSVGDGDLANLSFKHGLPFSAEAERTV